MQRCSPAVPDETAAQYGAPTASASSASNRGPVGPSESCPERSTSSTSSSSRSSIHGLESAIRRAGVDAHARVMLGHKLAPLRPAVARAAHRVEIGLLQLARDVPDADLVIVDRPQRRHLGGGAAHEHLVGEIQVGADQVLLDDLVARGRARSG